MVEVVEVAKKPISDEWGKAIVCVWKVGATNIPNQIVMDEMVDQFVERINAGRPNEVHALLADYRKFYYCPFDNTFRVASWFLDTNVSTVSAQFERTDFWDAIGAGYEPISFGYGKNFSDQATCLRNCMGIADTVNGKAKRRALGKEFLEMYANMPYERDWEEEDEDE